jgi:hypothetical protein
MSIKNMTSPYAVDPTEVVVDIQTQPIKLTSGKLLAVSLLRAQAELARNCLVPVDYTSDRGTCIDERPRLELLSGEPSTKARPSVPGGPDMYLLAILELTSYFPDDATDGKQRLTRAKQLLNEAGLLSGGHLQCAATAAFNQWMNIIAGDDQTIRHFARREKGANYNDAAMDEVIAGADKLVRSGRYHTWSENVLLDVLGTEASTAIERLADVAHEAVTLSRVGIPAETIDQTDLYYKSIAGKGSFVMDDSYADIIEHAASRGPTANWKKTIAEHAREAILAALAQVVPNPALYEVHIHQQL